MTQTAVNENKTIRCVDLANAVYYYLLLYYTDAAKSASRALTVERRRT